MSTQAALRKCATPLTIGASLLPGVTGILMFFHANSGLNALAQEWVGLAGGDRQAQMQPIKVIVTPPRGWAHSFVWPRRSGRVRRAPSTVPGRT